MAFQTTFKRYELKYILTLDQKAKSHILILSFSFLFSSLKGNNEMVSDGIRNYPAFFPYFLLLSDKKRRLCVFTKSSICHSFFIQF